MIILVINCGSSSVKYQLFNVRNLRCIARGVVERIGSPLASLKYQNNGKVFRKKVSCLNHYAAISIIVDSITDPKEGAIKSRDLIGGIGHRVVHGAEEFKCATRITPGVIRSIERYNELAPLHNPSAVSGIRACLKILSGVQQVAVFDTSFHQTMPSKAFLYGLPLRLYKKYGIRRYGFHGTSHRFVAHQAAKILNRPIKSLKLITCHLGNGCSMAAVKNGDSVDTTMGFTPLEGLVMGTRSGDLDPAVVFYLMENENISPERISDILNKESGLLGLSGVSNDMRDIKKAAKGADVPGQQSRIAIEVFIYRIEKYIGAYLAAMNGLDAVIFTAGIGENNPWIMKRVKRDLGKIVAKKVKFLIIPTNEELLIARDTFNIIKGSH
ncbi:MAG: acetate kinase [Candidatus Omnitrophica bacterium]|nr:acetate kinase [Candidatus Omnitrophota bacterium]